MINSAISANQIVQAGDMNPVLSEIRNSSGISLKMQIVQMGCLACSMDTRDFKRLLNLALGGNGGDPSKSQSPIQYEVDYVRVYQNR